MNKEQIKFNVKWLEYMNSLDVEQIKDCPNGHPLVYYNSSTTKEIVITCIHGGIGLGVDICDYFDYHTFRVPLGTKLNIGELTQK